MKVSTSKSLLAAGLILLAVLCCYSFSNADTYLRVTATYNNAQDTSGQVEHFVVFGNTIPVFIPPYTAHFMIYPLSETQYSVEVDFYELGPGYSHHHKELKVGEGERYNIENLPSKGMLFDYSFKIEKDTNNYLLLVPTDSLTNFGSTHFTCFIWRSSYADYKYNMRSGYLENIFDLYRKELDVTRAGKINLYIYPGSNNSPNIDNYTGVGFDLAGDNMYSVFNDRFDSTLPIYTQRFVIYDTWGYSPRMLAVGFSKYYFDDIYVARKLIAEMSQSEIKNLLSSEYPSDIEKADILSGAFVRFLIDNYGMLKFRKLYAESAPGRFMFDNNYKMSFDELLTKFIEYENNLKLTEPNASFFADLYTGQMWFDKALEYKIWLASQPKRKEYHLGRLGTAYFYTGNYARSESCFTALTALEPDNKKVDYILSLACLRTGKIDKAVDKLKSVAGDVPEAAKMLAEIYLDRQQYDKAQKYIKKAGRISDSWSALLEARLALIENNKGRADTMINAAFAFSSEVISMAPGESRGYVNAAYALMFGGDFKNAEAELSIALFVENRPFYQAMANLAFGRLYDLQADYESAREYYKQTIEIDSGEYINSLATSYLNKPFKLK